MTSVPKTKLVHPLSPEMQIHDSLEPKLYDISGSRVKNNRQRHIDISHIDTESNSKAPDTKSPSAQNDSHYIVIGNDGSSEKKEVAGTP